ncbi:MAG: hypothetical protein M1840_006580 [Geoglossum simile]|nr:MAG: hypothetical protein M1840_006580 [Geoglossum simile]
MSEQQSGEHSPADTLSSMVNLVLVQAGKVFRDPTKRSLGNLVHTRSRVGVMVSAALDSFHAALDELEVEILQAKEVLTRDLAVSRARRAKREREAADAAAAEKDRIAAEEASAREAEIVETEALNVSAVEAGEMDLSMADQFTDSQNNGTEGSAAKEADASEPTGQTKPPKPPPLNLSEMVGSDTKPPGGETSALHTTVETTIHPDSAARNDTPSTAGYKMDFGSMFDDPGADDMNFDLSNSFGGDGDDFLGNHSLGGDEGNPADASGAAARDVDVSALLPGLETYANAEDDTIMFGNPPSSALPPTTTTTTASASQALVPLLGESTDLLQDGSSFDDMFLSGMGDEGNGNFTSEFDDLFFVTGNG